jgi:hypothetical protein
LKSTSGGLPTRDAPPAVVAILPRDEQTEVSIDDAVRITFSKQIIFDAADYGPNSRFQLTDPSGAVVSASLAYDASNRQVVIRPSASLVPGALYMVTVSGGTRGVTDLEGQRMVFDYRADFRTTCPVRVTGGFGRLNALNPAIRHRIGCPEEEEYRTSATEQVFERGHMVYVESRRSVIVSFFADRRWIELPDPGVASGAPGSLSPPTGLVAPEGRFAQVWRNQPGVRDQLGWAIGRQRTFQGAAQRYAGGFMVWTGDQQWLLRIYFNDQGTLTVPDPNQPAATPSLQVESPSEETGP